jgi:hypothetical protein
MWIQQNAHILFLVYQYSAGFFFTVFFKELIIIYVDRRMIRYRLHTSKRGVFEITIIYVQFSISPFQIISCFDFFGSSISLYI